MNFENIFEKFSKELSKVPKKPRKPSPSVKCFFKYYSDEKHSLNKSYDLEKTIRPGTDALKEHNTTRNTNKGKTENAMQRRPLDVIALHKLKTSPHDNLEQQYCLSKSDSMTSLKNEANGFKYINRFKDYLENNTTIDDSYCKEKNYRQIRKSPLKCSFNLMNNTIRNRNNTKLSQLKPLDISVMPKRYKEDIKKPDMQESGNSKFDQTPLTNLDLSICSNEDLNESFSQFLSSSSIQSQFIENPTSTQNSDNEELTALIELIEQEERKTSMIIKPKTQKHSKSKVLNGGYEEIFNRAVKRSSTVGRFLKYNRKFDVQSGQMLRVVNVDTVYGTTFVTVECSDISLKPFGIVVSPELAPGLQIGTELEAFFDDSILPYKLNINNEVLDIYIMPYKILAV